MENNINSLIDMLYQMIDEAKSAPFSGDKCMILRDEALDLIEEIRAELPGELKRAQDMIRGREDYINSAKRDAERILQQADIDAKTRVSESEIVAAARQKAHDILHRAEDRSRDMYRVANEYTEDALRRTAEAIQSAMDELEQSRVRFRAASAEQMQRRRAELDRPQGTMNKNNGENS